MRILFFDTETTGKVDFNTAPDRPHQPRLVHFAAMLCDDEQEIQSCNLIIKPNGWVIPESAIAIHGITTEHALAVGVDCSVARHIYTRWWNASELVVAHNSDFDTRVMDGEFLRATPELPFRDVFCTMRAMTPVCKLPGTYSDYKWPKLQEAYRHCFGIEFDGAHNALADVRACAKIYRWLKEQKPEAPTA